MFLVPMLVLPLLLASCTRSVRQGGPATGAAIPASGYIAFTGTDGNIYVIDAAWGKTVRLTGNSSPTGEQRTEYHYPSWSFDGRKLAFVGYTARDDGGVQTTLHVSDTSDNRVKTIMKSMSVSPFYIYWSPDSNRISYLSLAPGAEGLIMQVIPASGGSPVSVDAGQPIYWSWAIDSQSILTHTGGSTQEQPDDAAIKLFDLSATGGGDITLNYFPAFFQAPEHSPDGEQLLIAAEMYRQQSTLVLASRDGEPQQLIVDWSGPLSFSWAPGGEKIAYITGEVSPIGGLIGTLNILAMDGIAREAPVRLPSSRVFAYFWSPDGTKIALFEPAILSAPDERQILVLNVSVLNVESGRLNYLLSIRPTRAFLGQVIPFYDQYQRSHTIWSPDSSHIVVNGVTEDNRPGIFAVDADGEGKPQLLAYGISPFWSWK
jgi:Tol biopolymer transport system component